MNNEQAFNVQINYKSGISVVMSFTQFSMSRVGTGGMSIEWRVPNGSSTKPLWLNVDEIESAYQLGVTN